MFIEKKYGSETLCLKTKFYPTDLAKVIDCPLFEFSIKEILWITKQLIQITKYLHSNNIVHRDIKPPNILIDWNGKIVLGDFDLARTLNDQDLEKTPNIGTRWYRAPELILGKNLYGKEIDIWSIGCLIAELVIKRPLFAGTSDIDQLSRIFNILGTPEQNAWKESCSLPFYMEFEKVPMADLKEVLGQSDLKLVDIVRFVLRLDPSKRPTVDNILESGFLKEIDDELTRQGFLKKLTLNKLVQI